MGCGRVGARLASTLDAVGHSVAIIDQDSKAFARLSPDFSGRRVTGVGMDRDCLRQANIKDAYAFAAVSSGDNSNIIAARVAREVFHVEHVVARIYDPTSGKTYKVEMYFEKPDVLTVKGKLGPFYKKMYWTKIQ